MNRTKEFIQSLWKGFTPPPKLTVSQWADKYRRLSPESSAEPGRWITARAEYQRGMMDAVNEPGIHTVVIMTSAQIGKALDVSTKIPTPEGWTTMGEIEKGDLVYGMDGKPVKVLGCSPVMEDRECYKLTFSGGAEITADGEHLWYVEPYEKKKGIYKTSVMFEDFRIELKNGKYRNRYAIPVCKPVEYALNMSIKERELLLKSLNVFKRQDGKCFFKKNYPYISFSFEELLSSLGIVYEMDKQGIYYEFYNDSRVESREIINIEKVESVPVRCILVDSIDHLFLAGDNFIPTHNTEGLVNNTVGYYIDQDPSPMLVVHPTLEMGQAWSKDRLAPMIRDTHVLSGKVRDAKAKTSTNTMMHKNFQGGQLTICGANSPASLASRPIRIVLCDEVDRYPGSAGAEGDPVNLAKKRTTTFWNRKVILTSTPTIKGKSRIENAFEESDQRRYFVTCPHCNHEHHMEWKNVKWPEGNPKKAKYHCPECGCQWSEVDRLGSIATGKWVATNSDGVLGVAGFHLNELYSPWVKPHEMAIAFMSAQKNKELLKTWINTSLGETWEERGESRSEDQIMNLKDDRPRGLVPQDADILILGADTQDNGFWFEIRAFKRGLNMQSWLVREGFVDNLDALEVVAYKDVYRDLVGVEYPVMFGMLDSAGHRTAEVYDWCRLHQNIKAIRGEKTMSAPYKFSNIDTYPGTSRRIPGGVMLGRVNVSYYKDLLASKLEMAATDPGSWLFHSEFPLEFAKHYTAEYRDPEKGDWICPSGRDNHLWDCSVYCLCAADVAGVRYEQQKQKVAPGQVKNPYTKGRNIYGR